MTKPLVGNREIGPTLSVQIDLDKKQDCVILALGSPDISASCIFKIQEWAEFVASVKIADKGLYLEDEEKEEG